MTEIFFSQLDALNIKNRLILLDIDGTIMRDGHVELDDANKQIIASLNANNKLYFCSNKNVCGRQEKLKEFTGVPCVEMAGRKPSKRAMNKVDNSEFLPITVIGDKFLTDGLFAKNIGAEFIKVKRVVSDQDTLFVKATYVIDDLFYSAFNVFSKIHPYLKLLRPQQWIKNLFIFAPLFFVQQFFVMAKLEQALWAFVIFCSTASAMYIVNDFIDIKNDQQHPQKKTRPLAAGSVKKWQAGFMLIVLVAFASWGIYAKAMAILPILAIYALLNILYSSYLKRLVIFDIILISFFYLLRILAGGAATSTPVSQWLTLCVIFITLFIIIGKRMSEFGHLNKREVLRYYNLDILEHLLTISAGLSVVSYGLYSILGAHSQWAVYSIFFVLLGVFRYLYIVHTSPEAEYPEKLVLKDKVVLGSVIAWVVYMYFILY